MIKMRRFKSLIFKVEQSAILKLCGIDSLRGHNQLTLSVAQLAGDIHLQAFRAVPWALTGVFAAVFPSLASCPNSLLNYWPGSHGLAAGRKNRSWQSDPYPKGPCLRTSGFLSAFLARPHGIAHKLYCPSTPAPFLWASLIERQRRRQEQIYGTLLVFQNITSHIPPWSRQGETKTTTKREKIQSEAKTPVVPPATIVTSLCLYQIDAVSQKS